MEDSFEIAFIDHVAIRVNDLDQSVNWYRQTLGLKKLKLKEWGEFPVFMLANKCGVALFPANLNDDYLNPHSKNIKIDHFAFNVSKENFEKAKNKFTRLQIDFEVQDHFYFDSIYIKDPDGHTVELTSIKTEYTALLNRAIKSST